VKRNCFQGCLYVETYCYRGIDYAIDQGFRIQQELASVKLVICASRTSNGQACEDQQRIVDQTGAKDRVEIEFCGGYRR